MEILYQPTLNFPDARKNRYIMYAAVALRLYMNLGSLGLIVSLPIIIKGFGSMHLYPVISVSYTAILAITSLLGGRLGIFIGRKITIITALSGIMCGSIACAFAPSLAFFLLGYMLFGLSYGVSLSMPIALLCDVSTLVDRPKYMGIYTAANNIGMLVGPFLGGFITDSFGFTYTPIYSLPLAIIALVLLTKFYPRHNQTKHNVTFDFKGLILLALGIAPLVIGLNLGGNVLPWSSPGIIAMIAGGALFSVLFVIFERKTSHPLLAVNLFKVKSFSVANLMLLLIVPYFAISNSYVILFVQDGLHRSATISGTMAMPKTLLVLLMAVLLGRWITRSTQYRKRLMMLSGLLVAVAEIVLSLTAGMSSAIAFIYICMALFGIAELLYFMTLQPYMQSELSDQDVHAAMSIQSFSTVMGICIMSAVFGVVLNANSGNIFVSFPKMSMITAACSIAFIAVGSIFIKE